MYKRQFLLNATSGPSGPKIQIDVVDHSKINRDLYLDLIGLRLWVDNAESHKLLHSHIGKITVPLEIRQQLTIKIMEHGIEPDMIPVRGEEGKKMGSDDMVFLKGGEFMRGGEYWDSSGGGLADDSKPFHAENYRCLLYTSPSPRD